MNTVNYIMKKSLPYALLKLMYMYLKETLKLLGQ